MPDHYVRVLPKKRTKIKCPRCEKIWYASRYWEGRGLLREFCKECKWMRDNYPTEEIRYELP